MLAGQCTGNAPQEHRAMQCSEGQRTAGDEDAFLHIFPHHIVTGPRSLWVEEKKEVEEFPS